MRELLGDYDRLKGAGPVGRGVVTRVWGSAPRTTGATMLATADGRTAGSVSGGCVEGAVAQAIARSIESGQPELLTFSVSDDRAWEVGLACGGTIDVFVEPTLRDAVLVAARASDNRVVPTVIGGAAPLGDPDADLVSAVDEAARIALRDRTSSTTTVVTTRGEVTVFLEVFAARPTLLIVGAVHIAEHLARFAKPLGYRVVVTDGRAALLARERFPDADELLLGWPDETFPLVKPDESTAVCVLSHDPKFDEPALRLALRSPAGYIGAIGSGKTQRARRARLRDEGFAESDVARLHGPIGLDLGGRDPAEIALAILAQITALRYGRSPSDYMGLSAVGP